MAEYPQIRDYKPFYIQTSSDSSAVDIAEEYGFVVRDSPLPDHLEAKEPAKNEWHDEHGDDEYVEQMFYKAVEYEFEVCVITSATATLSAAKVLANQKKAFFNKVKQGYFKFFNGYWDIGRQNVRFVGTSEGEKKQYTRDGVPKAREIFKIKFKINDPITDMVMSGGSIVETQNNG